VIATSADVIKAIRSWRAAGKTLPQMEAMLQGAGITMVRSTIWKYCYDIPGPNVAKRERARALSISGWTLQQIADELEVAVSTVQRWCADLRLKRGRKTPLEGAFGNGLQRHP
jgi:DNA-binding NarL/FixJ family response regulator